MAIFVNYNEPQQLVLQMNLSFIATVVLMCLILLLNLLLSGTLAAVARWGLSYEGYRRTLWRPYLMHFKYNSRIVISAMMKHIEDNLIALYIVLRIISSFVVSTIEKRTKNLLIMILAHRSDTVHCCDRLICLIHGLVSAYGLPQQVISVYC